MIVVKIYSEISLLTPAAQVLNEWSVKLMGQIQSSLVTHFTPHTHTHTCITSLLSFSEAHTHLPVSRSVSYNSERHQDMVSAL